MTWNEPEDQTLAGTGAVWRDLAGGDLRVKGCSDLLEDFLKKIGQMESEYLRAFNGSA
ncbi:hypothetical protein [Streptomyces glomeratus]|uniref:hypothetical protein n=1 Tax=Streptomyces glomeratus TaxID=284452 RepID=UPI001F4742E6|nr:hypothetical protein [Streptomyces glomeratus]MCF1507189.1 hypothetical protein [Streptomyces glomeratus]